MSSGGLDAHVTDLEQAYRGGSRDDGTVKTLDRLYIKDGRWLEAAQLCEEAASGTNEWKSKVWYLKHACSRFNRIKDMVSFVRCHRKARSAVPVDVSAQLRLDIWCPTGLVVAYPHTDSADEALSELSEIGQAIGEEWSVYGRFVYHFARSLIYRELGEWDKMIDEGNQFVRWVEVLSEHDDQFLRLHEYIGEDADPVLAGESGRCYCTCTALAECIALAQQMRSYDSAGTFLELDKWLARYEEFYLVNQCRSDESPDDLSLQEAAGIYKHRASTCYGKAAVAAYELGQPMRALEYFQQSERLRGAIEGIWQFYRAAALLAVGRVEEAKSRLREVSGSAVSNGLGSAVFDKIKEFDSIRNDPDITNLVKEWRSVGVKL